jgi:hypothetical protein
MSQSLLPKNLPDLLRQENLDKTLEVLRQPFSLAILASLGVHALLGVTLPMLPAAKHKEPDPEAVKVVELSPAEQARIPELSNPQVNFPPVSSKTKLPDQSSKSSIAKTPPSIFDDSLYNFPALPPAPISIFPDIPIPIRDSPQRTVVNRTATPTPTPTPTVKPTSSSTATATKPDTQPSAPAPPASVASTRPEKIPQAAIVALREEQEKIRRDQELANAVTGVTGAATATDGTKQLQEWQNNIAQTEKVSPDAFVIQTPHDASIPCPDGKCPDQTTKIIFLLAVNPDNQMVGKPRVLAIGDSEQTKTVQNVLTKDVLNQIRQQIETSLKESKSKDSRTYKIYSYRLTFVDSKAEK